MATSSELQALIDARQKELEEKIETSLNGLQDFVEDFWANEEYWDRSNWPSDNLILFNPITELGISTLISAIDDVALPPAPTYTGQVNAVTAYNRRQWQDPNFDAISASIQNALLNGGSAISATYQTAIFNTDSERKLQTLNDALLIVAAKTGGRGFRKPTSVTAAQENELILKYQYDLENQSREITKLIEEHMRTNWQSAVQQGIALENLHIDFALKYADMFNKSIEYIIRAYEADVRAYLSNLDATIKKITAKADLSKLGADVRTAYNQQQVSIYQSEIDLAYKKASTTVTDRGNQANAQLSGMNSIAGSYGAMYQSLSQSNIAVSTTKTTAS